MGPGELNLKESYFSERGNKKLACPDGQAGFLQQNISIFLINFTDFVLNSGSCRVHSVVSGRGSFQELHYN